MIADGLTILEIINRYRDEGGEDRAADQMCALLRRHGHRVIVLSDDSRRIRSTGDRIAAAFHSLYSLTAQRTVRDACASVRPDVVHVHNLYPLWSPSVLVAAARAGVPIVMTVHNYGLTCPIRTHVSRGQACRRCAESGEHWCVLRNCRANLLESTAYATRAWVARRAGWIGRHVTVFVAVSRSVAAYLRATGISEERIAVAPNAVEVPAVAADASRGAYALYVGRLSPEKGLATLRTALGMADASVCLHVVGTGPEEARLRSDGSGRMVLHGWLPPERVAAMYAQARFTVVPSVCEETFSLSAAESMSHGVPVIASRTGGLPELVDDGVTGSLCEPGNAGALAECMSRLWRDPMMCRRMGEAARRAVIERYSGDRCYEHLAHAYERALTLRPPPGDRIRVRPVAPVEVAPVSVTHDHEHRRAS